MKDLKGWKMGSVKFKLVSLLLICNSCILSADGSILSKDRTELFFLNEKQIEENSQKLKKDWINPITLKYIKNYDEIYDQSKSTISISQPIFKSGGIYQAIKYASSLQKYQNLDVESQKKAMIKEATNLLFQIYKTKAQIKKQKLLVQNADIEIQTKREQVLSGLLDTSTLDSTILDANVKKNALLDLEYQLDNIIISFSNLSDKPYDSLELPKFSIINKDHFLGNNIYVAKARADIDTKNWQSKMSISKYLPTINFTYDYTKYHDTDSNPAITDNSTTKYGFNLTIPLDTRTFNDIQSSKIEHLKSKTTLNTVRSEEENLLNSKLAKLDILDKKKIIAKDDVKLYDSLLSQMVELRDAGLKTDTDVQTLKNSMEIKSLDINIIELDKQIELLEIYARVVK